LSGNTEALAKEKAFIVAQKTLSKTFCMMQKTLSKTKSNVFSVLFSERNRLLQHFEASAPCDNIIFPQRGE
jgi:hypothetical protein